MNDTRKANKIMTAEERDLCDDIINYGIATEQEMALVLMINGTSIEQLNNIIYAKTGYRNIEQFIEEENK